jgi:hypothetical protein
MRKNWSEKGWLIGFLGAALLILGVGGEAPAQQFVIKHGHVGSVDDEDQHAALVFKDFVETQSKGRLKVEIYPAAQLGSFREQLESVAIGNPGDDPHGLRGGRQYVPRDPGHRYPLHVPR